MVDDVVVSVKTEVEKAEELVKLKDNLARFGEASEEVGQGVDDLVESINAIAEAKEIADDIAKTTEAFNEQAEALEKAKEEYKRADEALLEFGDSLSDIEKKEAEAVVKAHEKEVERLTKAYEKAEKAMTKANDKFGASSSHVQKLASDSRLYEEELARAVERQEELNASLADMREFSFAKQDLGIKGFQEEIDKLNASYETLANSGKLSAEELQLAHQNLTAEVKRYQRQLDGTDVALKNLKRGLPTFLAVSGAIVKATKDAVEFETAMSDVAKVLGGTDEEVKALSNSILQLSEELPIAATGLAEIAESGALIGLKADELETYTKQVAKMATAFGMSTQKSGKSVADMMNVFQVGLEGVSDLSDAINYLSNNTAADAEDIIESLTRIGGSAQGFGLAKEQAAALAGQFIALGKSPEIASTAINSFLTDLITAEKQGTKYQEALEKIDLTGVELAQSIRDNPQEAIIDFLGRINELEDATGVLTDMFGKANQSNIASLANSVDQLGESFGMIAERSKYAGSVNEEFNNKLKTTQAQMNLLANRAKNLSITIGQLILPALNAGINAASGFADAINRFTEAHPALTKVALVLVAIGGSARVLHAGFKLLEIQGHKTSTALTAGLTKVGVSAKGATLAVKGLNAAMLGLGAISVGASVGEKLRDQFVWMEKTQNTVTHGYMQMWTAAKGLASSGATLLTKGPKEAGRILKENTAQLELQGQVYDEMQANAGKQAQWERERLENEKRVTEEKANQARLDRISGDGDLARSRAEANEIEAASIERLNEQLSKFNLSYNSIEEGITKKGNDAINTFQRIGKESAVTSNIIRESFIAALAEIETPVEAQKLIDSFEELRSQTNEAGDAFKVTAEDAIMLAPELLTLQEAIANGAKVDADWAEVLTGVNEQLEKKRLGLMAVTSEHEKQVEAINKQLKKEEELIDSKIRALQAERDLATARDDLARAAELNRQIAEQELQLLNKQVATNAKLTELDQQALARLEAKREAGEKLTKAELEQIDALKHSIALRANEVAALGASAEAKAMDTQATDANTAALQRRNNAASGASKSIKKTAEAVDEVDKATKKTTSSGGGSTKFSSWLKDAGDTALLAQSQIDGLKNSVLGAQKYLVGGVQDIHGFVNANKHLRYEIEQLQKGVDRFKSLRDEISALKDPTLDQVLNFEAMANSINFIDDQALGAVKSQLQGMKDEILALRQESEQLLDSLKEEQAKAMGRDYRLTQSQKLLEIEEKIAEAKAKGDMTAVRNLEEAMGIQQRIDRISYVKNRREEEPKITKRVAIDLNIGNEPHQMETDEQTAERVLRAIERKKRVSTRR